MRHRMTVLYLAGVGGEQLVAAIGLLEHAGQARGTGTRRLGAAVSAVVRVRCEFWVPTEARLKPGGGVHDPVAPMDAQEALAA